MVAVGRDSAAHSRTARMKDGTTHLAYMAEHGSKFVPVDLYK
jgi:hypothetical protein